MPWGRHRMGVPISHNALQHFPECHGADIWGGGYPARSSQEGYPAGGTLPGGTLLGWGYPTLGTPSQVRMGGTLQGGTLLGEGYPGRVPPARSGMGGYPARGTQLGQQKKYSLHRGRYASCVHAGGLSCFFLLFQYL